MTGLDLTTLRAIRGRRHDHRELLDRIGRHLELHDGYVAFSGGKDSTAVLHLALQVDPGVPVVWFDSGLEFPETRTYIADLADAWDLNLTVLSPTPNLLDILRATGAWSHDTAADSSPRPPDLHQALITAPAAAAHERFGAGELWGVRSSESRGRRSLHAAALARADACTCCPDRAARRAAHGGAISRANGTTAYSPIWDWPTRAVWEYLAAHQVPTNPLYTKLEALGVPTGQSRVSHVLDGAHLERGRVTWLKRGWPTLYSELVTALPLLADLS